VEWNDRTNCFRLDSKMFDSQCKWVCRIDNWQNDCYVTRPMPLHSTKRLTKNVAIFLRTSKSLLDQNLLKIERHPTRVETRCQVFQHRRLNKDPAQKKDKLKSTSWDNHSHVTLLWKLTTFWHKRWPAQRSLDEPLFWIAIIFSLRLTFSVWCWNFNFDRTCWVPKIKW